MNSPQPKPKIAFFGTPDFAVTILDTLKNAGMIPSLIITNPDMPKGRNMIVTSPPVKIWAGRENVPVRQPENLKDGVLLNELKQERWDMFIVVAYGKIIPREIINLPLHNTLNIHGSILPKYRGASPIQSAILADDKETGISIMILDEEMDHGPVLASEKITEKNSTPALVWPPTTQELEKTLAQIGGRLLVKTIPLWIERKITAIPQDHHKATYTKKITKADGEIDLSADPYQNFLKIQAFSGWPGTYFFEKNAEDESGNNEPIRMTIKKAEFKNGKLRILRVVPSGKKEIDYKEPVN